MQQNQIASLILLGFLIVLIYQEINLIRRFLFYKKNGKMAYGEIVKRIQPHNSNPIYKVKIENMNLPYSKHRIKITILSSFFPMLLNSDFKLYYLDNEDYCIVANPMMIILDWIYISLFILLLIKLN